MHTITFALYINAVSDRELRKKRIRGNTGYPTPLQKRLDAEKLMLDLSQATDYGDSQGGKRRKTSIVIEPILQGSGSQEEPGISG